MITTSSDEMSLEPAARSVPLVAGDTPAMREWAEQHVARARAEGVELAGDRARVRVSGEISLVAEVTPAAVAELALAAGGEVWISVKATEVAVYPA